ncbi:hypothetical protein GEMRC1_008786 [Eukaryota sp. GEM-RC1]
MLYDFVLEVADFHPHWLVMPGDESVVNIDLFENLLNTYDSFIAVQKLLIFEQIRLLVIKLESTRGVSNGREGISQALEFLDARTQAHSKLIQRRLKEAIPLIIETSRSPVSLGSVLPNPNQEEDHVPSSQQPAEEERLSDDVAIADNQDITRVSVFNHVENVVTELIRGIDVHPEKRIELFEKQH